jgi:pilus assembly protein CpaF
MKKCREGEAIKMTLRELIDGINTEFKENESAYVGYFASDEAEDEFRKLSEIEFRKRMNTTKGDTIARDLLLDKIYFSLTTKYKDEVRNENINEILSEYHFSYFENIYCNDKSLLVDQVDEDIFNYFEEFKLLKFDPLERKIEFLSKIIYQEVWGFSIIDSLIFDFKDINEVDTNRYDYIVIQYKGIKKRILNPRFKFENNKTYETVAGTRICANANAELTTNNPYVYSNLKNGFRVTVLRNPLSKDFVVAVRRFENNNLGNKWNLLNEKVDTLMSLLVKSRQNIVIIGEMGSGKTTFINEKIISNYDKNTSIGLIENIHELDISRTHPKLNVIEMQYQIEKDISPTQLTSLSLRLNRDVLIFGEVRNPEEAYELLKAFTRLNKGSVCTFHSSSPENTIYNLRQLLMETKLFDNYKICQFDVANAIDVIIHLGLDKKTGRRYISRICEVIANHNDLSFQVNTLVKYDKKNNTYIFGEMSREMFESIAYELEDHEVEKLRGIFQEKSDV